MTVLIARAVTIAMTVLMTTMVTIRAEDSGHHNVFLSDSVAKPLTMRLRSQSDHEEQIPVVLE